MLYQPSKRSERMFRGMRERRQALARRERLLGLDPGWWKTAGAFAEVTAKIPNKRDRDRIVHLLIALLKRAAAVHTATFEPGEIRDAPNL